MNVILQSDVKSLGKKGEMVKVSDGYARNFLFPRKLALEASASNVNTMNIQNEAKAFHKAAEKEEAEKLKEKIEEVTILLKAKAGANGKLFGSITSKEIAEELLKVNNISIDKKKIGLSEPIKAFGTYSLDIKIYSGISAKLNIVVTES